MTAVVGGGGADRRPAGRRILVTGTDTGVGKTYVACLLGKRLRREGTSVRPVKPVESGCAPGPDGRPFPADAAALRDAMAPGLPLPEVCLHAFAAPLSPHLAARRDGVDVDPAQVRRLVARAGENSDVALVEGAGGIAVEIAQDYTFADLARDAGLSVLVVAENRLGVLSHLRLTLSFLRSEGLALAGVILNDRSPGGFPARELNGPEAARIAGGGYLGRIPWGASSLPDAVFGRFAAKNAGVI